MASEEDEVRALLTRHRQQIIRDFSESKLVSVLLQKGVLNGSNERLLNEIQNQGGPIAAAAGDKKPQQNGSPSGITAAATTTTTTTSISEFTVNEINEKKCNFLIDVIARNGFEKFKEFCFAIENECPQLIEDLINDRLKAGKLILSFTKCSLLHFPTIFVLFSNALYEQMFIGGIVLVFR